MTQGPNDENDYCNWCNKPQSQWANILRHEGFRKSYCSARCYAAGEYRINLYFALCSIPIVGFGIAFVSFHLLSNPSGFYIGVTLFLIAIFVTYSSICAYIPMIRKFERRKRESVSK